MLRPTFWELVCINILGARFLNMNDRQTTSKKDRAMLVIVALAFLLLRLLNFTLVDIRWSDINLYTMLAERMAAGQKPYIDFPLEYPPLALPFIVVPGWLSGGGESYANFFRLQMMLFDIGSLILLVASVRRLFPGDNGKILMATVIYLVLTAISFQVLYDRFDMVIAFLVMLAIYLALISRWAWAYIAILAGVFAKLTPAILLPLAAIWQYRSEHKTSPLVRDLGIAVIIGAVSLIVSVLIFGEWWGYMLEYHGGRGIQIESIYSSLILILNFAGIEAAINHQFGAFQVTNVFSNVLAGIAMPLMAAGVLGAYVIFFFKAKVSDPAGGRKLFVECALVTLLGFVIFNKVLSPQFLIWLFPLAAVMATFTRDKITFIALWSLAAVMTTLIFPYLYRQLVLMQALPVTILALRNACLIALTVLVFLEMKTAVKHR
jgi:hypothetical protein